MLIAIFSLGLWSLPIPRGPDEVLDSFSTSRSLFATIHIPTASARTDFSVYLIIRHMLSIIQIAAWVLLVRLVLLWREPSPRPDAPGVNLAVARKLRNAGDRAWELGQGTRE